MASAQKASVSHTVPNSGGSQNAITLGLVVSCFVLISVVLFISSTTRPVIAPLVAKESLEHWLYSAPNNVAGGASLRYREELEQVYRKTQHQLIWMDHYQLNSAGNALVKNLRHTASDEWKAYGFRISKLQTELKRLDNQPKHAAAIDVLLTDAYIDFARQVFNKELLPNTGELDHPSFRKVAAPPTTRVTSLDVISLLSQSLEQGKLHELVKQLVPNHPGYERLGRELERYQDIAESGLWYPLEIENPLKAGDHHAQIPRLKWMLNAYGDYQKSAMDWLVTQSPNSQLDPLALERQYRKQPEHQVYKIDEPTVRALKHYQKRNGLLATGRLDQETLAQLNEPPYFIAQRIALNMKRWRYLPKELGDDYILVNMADFRLNYFSKGERQLDMKVIIGKEHLRTPVLAETISAVILAPEWNVPHRIAIRDILPQAKRDPDFLKKHNFKVYEGWTMPPKEVPLEGIDFSGFQSRSNTYRLVQAPGEDNSLGNVKFVFPNDKSIYLHDTNHKELFARDMRALSSGCIRVEKPLALANALLGRQNWDEQLISNVIDRRYTRPVRLKDPVPVYLMYWTTWVNEQGTLQVRRDVYNRDQINNQSHKLDSIVL